MNTTGPETVENEQSGAPKKVIASAVIIATIVALGIILSLMNVLGGQKGSTPTASAPSTTTTPTPTNTTPTAAAEPSVCGLKPVELTGTITTAPVATWTLVGTIAAPSIKEQGPGRVESDGYRSCYAHTPTGAVLAAGNLIAMGGNGPIMGRKLTERSTVPGQGRDAALARPAAPQDSSGVRIQIAGFRVLRYDGTHADVDVAIRTSNGALAAQVFNLQWAGGDWKVMLAPSGDMTTPMSQIPTLGGYVMWSGA